MYDHPKFLISGDSCLVVEFSDIIEMGANARLQYLRRTLAEIRVAGIRELVPTYRSLSIYYDPIKLPRAKLEVIVNGAITGPGDGVAPEKRVLVMPVAYGGEFGPDMANVAEHTKLDEGEIIKRHTAGDYYCYMLGFAPGFGYLGGLDESLATPRLKTPRTLIPAGSVGIAGSQTGAYSIDSPGGWQLIGRTPLRLFDPGNGDNPTLMDAGDWIRFRSITKDEFEAIKSVVKDGKYRPEHLIERGGEL
jgi:KipI family sensor histidine kinase inhibitor